MSPSRAGLSLCAALLAASSLASAAETDAPFEPPPFEADSEETKHKRHDYLGKRAGLRLGTWGLDADERAGDYSESPVFVGYFEKDLDVRLSLESTLGYYRRSVSRTDPGDVLAPPSSEETEGYVVPMFTNLKFYPRKHRDRRLAPYVSAGIGLALGVEKTRTTGSLFSSAGDGAGTQTGYGYGAGAGLDWNLGPSFGLSLAGRYENLRFDEEIVDERYYKGFVASFGATYRFQKN